MWLSLWWWGLGVAGLAWVVAVVVNDVAVVGVVVVVDVAVAVVVVSSVVAVASVVRVAVAQVMRLAMFIWIEVVHQVELDLADGRLIVIGIGVAHSPGVSISGAVGARCCSCACFGYVGFCASVQVLGAQRVCLRLRPIRLCVRCLHI